MTGNGIREIEADIGERGKRGFVSVAMTTGAPLKGLLSSLGLTERSKLVLRHEVDRSVFWNFMNSSAVGASNVLVNVRGDSE